MPTSSAASRRRSPLLLAGALLLGLTVPLVPAQAAHADPSPRAQGFTVSPGAKVDLVRKRRAPVKARGSLRTGPGSSSNAIAADGTTVSLVPARPGPARSTWNVTYTGFTPEAEAAFQRAVDYWAAIITSPVPINVSASFEPKPEGVLGSAGPSVGYPGGPLGIGDGASGYPSALADALKGQDLGATYGFPYDIDAVFSSTATGINYGEDLPTAGEVDFTTIVMHELGHGLGFSGGLRKPDAFVVYDSPSLRYNRFTVDALGNRVGNYPSGSVQLTAAATSGALFWDGAEATAANAGVEPKLYAPTTWTPGSSYSHLDESTFPTGDPDSLLTPVLYDQEVARNPGEVAVGMLRDLGWTASQPVAVPGTPTAVRAEVRDKAAAISWTAPADGADIATYTATASPGGATCSSTTTACTISGLSNGTAYTVTVAASNAGGSGPASAPSNSVTPVRPWLTVGDVTVPEGDSGSYQAWVPMRLSHPASSTVSAAWTTLTGTAGTADFAAASGTATFAPGVTSKLVPVTVKPDSIDEPAELFYVKVTSATGAGISDAKGDLKIVDNDGRSKLAVSNVRLYEGNSGFAYAYFTVRLSAPASSAVTADYTTAANTAAAGVDFTSTSGTVTFAPGELAKTIGVKVKGDEIDEGDETFRLELSGVSGPAVIADGVGQGKIVDDDPLAGGATPTLRIGDLTMTEGHTGTSSGNITVQLSAPSATPVTANYKTTAHTADAADAELGSGTITIPAGATSTTVRVTVKGDAVAEGTEVVKVTLGGASGATLADWTGTVTIVDDDGKGKIAISDVKVVEGNAGDGAAVFVVRLSAPATTDVTVSYGTAAATASPGADFTASTGLLTIPAGQISRTLSVPVATDLMGEAKESFKLVLSGPTGAAISDFGGVATVVDDD